MFVTFLRIADKFGLHHQAKKNANEFMFTRLISKVQYTRDGRIAAHVPAMPFDDGTSEEARASLRADAIRSMAIHRGLTVDAGILPAWRVLREKHRLERHHFIEMVQKSSVAPQDRRQSVARGLYEGYTGDFGTALYLLTPQVENIVRTSLNAAGYQTTTIETPSGVENEKGLSALMEMPEAEQVFGENLAFELQVLFCDALGPNLRNNAAHGLLSDAETYSHETVYAWWLVFRMVMIPIINASRPRHLRSSRIMTVAQVAGRKRAMGPWRPGRIRARMVG